MPSPATQASLTAPADGVSSNEFRRGWGVIAASMLGISCGLTSVPFYTFGVFAPHLAKAFGWSIGQIMGGLSVTTLVVIGAAPAAGVLAQRFGERIVVMTSLVLFALAYMALALLDGRIGHFYAAFALIAAVGAGTLPMTWTRCVNRWFLWQRGLALGVAMMGTGVFGMLSKPYLAWAIGHWGWRGGYVALGLLPLLLALPVAAMLFRDPPGMAVVASLPADAVLPGLTVAQALRQRAFWVLALALFPIAYSLAGMVPNLETILAEGGLAPGQILALTPLVGLSAIVGRLLGGYLLDRFWAPAVACVLLGLPALSCWILAKATLTSGVAAGAIALDGLALGIEFDVMAYLTARYFGLRSYGAIYGIFYVVFALGSGTAPMVFGMIRDHTHSFAPALEVAGVLLSGAAACLLLMGRYPDRA